LPTKNIKNRTNELNRKKKRKKKKNKNKKNQGKRIIIISDFAWVTLSVTFWLLPQFCLQPFFLRGQAMRL
jgi:hypothetical protein